MSMNLKSVESISHLSSFLKGDAQVSGSTSTIAQVATEALSASSALQAAEVELRGIVLEAPKTVVSKIKEFLTKSSEEIEKLPERARQAVERARQVEEKAKGAGVVLVEVAETIEEAERMVMRIEQLVERVANIVEKRHESTETELIKTVADVVILQTAVAALEVDEFDAETPARRKEKRELIAKDLTNEIWNAAAAIIPEDTEIESRKTAIIASRILEQIFSPTSTPCHLRFVIYS